MYMIMLQDEHIFVLLQKYEKEDNNGRFKLRDVLSVPMQRILKYHLLLDKLIENTDPVSIKSRIFAFWYYQKTAHT